MVDPSNFRMDTDSWPAFRQTKVEYILTFLSLCALWRVYGPAHLFYFCLEPLSLYCYRTFPVLGCACNFPSAQQACKSFFRVIYVGGPLKGPQLTTTADTLTPTRYCLLSVILFVN